MTIISITPDLGRFQWAGIDINVEPTEIGIWEMLYRALMRRWL